MRLLLTTFVTFLFTLMLYFTIKFWGLGQDYKSYDTPWLTQPSSQKVILRIKEPDEIRKVLELRTSAVSSADVVFWLDVHMSLDSEFFSANETEILPLLTPEKLGISRYHGDKFYFYALNDLRMLNSKIFMLKEYFEQFPESKFILNIEDNAQNVHLSLIKFLEERNLQNRVLLQSQIDVIMKSLKSERPTWIFGTSLPEITRLLSFESLGLESAPQIRADAWISPLFFKNRSLLTNRLITELRRRKKYIYLGPLLDESQVVMAQKYKPDGLILDHWEMIKNLRSDVTM